MERLTEAQEKLYGRIQKLLNLASSNPNEAEATAAAAKAQELLTEYNLDASLIGAVGKEGAQREDMKTRGGFYKFQRYLWANVADLNFCLYWTQIYYETKDVWDKDRYSGRWVKNNRPYQQKRHRLIGKKVNVAATVAMAQYLEGAVERIVRAKISGDNQKYSAWAVSFREGCIARICEKLQARQIANEEARRKADQEAMQKAQASGFSTSRALALADVKQAEEDDNIDFAFGAGTAAKRRARQQEQAEEAARIEREYTAWAAAHPEEAKQQEAERRKREREKQERARYSSTRQFGDGGGYWAGYEEAEAISLDPRVETPTPKKLEARHV